MFKQLRNITTLLLLLINSIFTSAQTQSFDHTNVDSLTFIETRAVINKLSTAKFQKGSYNHGDKKLLYRLLLPKNYDKTKKYPLVITFHNSTRIGTDNEKQLEPLSKIWIREEIYTKYNCFVIAPQFAERSSNYTENEDGILVSKPSDDVQLVLELLKTIENEYRSIDKSRIYLVGYSMGASTAQNLMSIAPKKFAAIVSVAAVPDFSNLKVLKEKNIFLIHGQKDTENPYNGSVNLYAKLSRSKNLTFKTYTELDHDYINIPLLLSDEIPKWLFKLNK
ncbi:phospholipase [Pedobacter polaris]|uniref:Phospholipase n=1 Tax=Pedobacter polaris TaxID=2571273 RepID=A0A4U1CTD9_9SPHI|nr:alpha/beta hydrolase-fold protein [Pedobacter polaris]TKC10846.1 phospholipase [Pedobacter polaris]